MTPEELVRYGYYWCPGAPIDEVPQERRRDPTDPYCPSWCPYQCTGQWKRGECLIRIPAVTKQIYGQYLRQGRERQLSEMSQSERAALEGE